MNSIIKRTAFVSVSLLLFSVSVPLTQAANISLRASERRCDRLAGREKTRCMYVHERTKRLHYQRLDSGIVRGHTLREQRVITRNKPATNVRLIGDVKKQALRTYVENGYNVRRSIQQKEELARTTCQGFVGTEKHQCIRKNMIRVRDGSIQ